MELIEKQAAMDCCFKPQVRPNEEIFNALKMAIRSEISALQSVDAASVVHGKWEPHHTRSGKNWWQCNICGAVSEHKRDHYYCHFCGAKMDGVKQDDNG